jgi:5-methylcytosine-specific restriction endonuclease McrA
VPASKRLPLLWKTYLLERDGYRCIYCAKPYDPQNSYLHTLDHLIPRRHGGPDAKWNLAIACETCNCSKQARVWTAAIDKLIENIRGLIIETRLEIALTR